MKKSVILFLSIFLFSAVSYGAGRYRGDLNGDGRVDLTDMCVLAKAINSGAADASYDINNSGMVDDNDLHVLANIIISESLTEEGLNVGIGGWDDDGTDYGGAVGYRAPMKSVAEETNFYLRNACAEKSGGYSVEFGIDNTSDGLCAILFNIIVANETSFDISKMVELSGNIIDGHALYGKPVVVKKLWEDTRIRFIVLSPDLKPLKNTSGALGRIYYDTDSYSDRDPYFQACQVLTSGGSVAEFVHDHNSGSFEWSPDAQDFTLGDVNGDEKINVSDIVSLVNYISESAPAIFVEEAADVNQDNKINVADIVTLVNLVSNQ